MNDKIAPDFVVVNSPEARVAFDGTGEREGRFADATESVVLWAFAAGLAWLPFWLGGAELLSWSVNAIAFPFLVIVYEVSILAGGGHHGVALKHLRVPALLFASAIIWIIVQRANWTPSLLHNPVWTVAAEALGRPVDGSISVNRDLSTLGMIRLITAASVFWLALQLGRDPRHALLLLKAVALIVCAYSAYGLIALFAASGKVLWLDNPFNRSVVTATFYNRNSFATYAGIGLITICGLIFRSYRLAMPFGGESIRFRIASFLEATGQRAASLVAAAFIILVALLLTGSRGGIITTAAALCAWALLTFKAGNRAASRPLEVLLFIACIVAACFLAFGDIVAGHISESGLYDEGRTAAYTIILRSIFDAPLMGFGYGTFVDVFPMYRDRSISVLGFWEKAHGTYLEVFQGLGLIFGAALVISVLILVVRCAKGAISRQEGTIFPCVAASVAFLVGVHALVDFSLQLQAVSLTFAALLGVGVAQSTSSRVTLKD